MKIEKIRTGTQNIEQLEREIRRLNEELESYRAELVIKLSTYSRTKWYEEGEKNTKYFFK